MKYLAIATLIGCLLGDLAIGQNPGFRTAITAKALSYSELWTGFFTDIHMMCSWAGSVISSPFLVSSVSLPILEQQLSNIKIPDVSGSASVDVIGNIDYTFSKYSLLPSIKMICIVKFFYIFCSIKLFNLKIATFNIKTSTVGLSVIATGISIDGSTDWKYSNHGW